MFRGSPYPEDVRMKQISGLDAEIRRLKNRQKDFKPQDHQVYKVKLQRKISSLQREKIKIQETAEISFKQLKAHKEQLQREVDSYRRQRALAQGQLNSSKNVYNVARKACESSLEQIQNAQNKLSKQTLLFNNSNQFISNSNKFIQQAKAQVAKSKSLFQIFQSKNQQAKNQLILLNQYLEQVQLRREELSEKQTGRVKAISELKSKASKLDRQIVSAQDQINKYIEIIGLVREEIFRLRQFHQKSNEANASRIEELSRLKHSNHYKEQQLSAAEKQHLQAQKAYRQIFNVHHQSQQRLATMISEKEALVGQMKKLKLRSNVLRLQNNNFLLFIQKCSKEDYLIPKMMMRLQRQSDIQELVRGGTAQERKYVSKRSRGGKQMRKF